MRLGRQGAQGEVLKLASAAIASAHARASHGGAVHDPRRVEVLMSMMEDSPRASSAASGDGAQANGGASASQRVPGNAAVPHLASLSGEELRSGGLTGPSSPGGRRDGGAAQPQFAAALVHALLHFTGEALEDAAKAVCAAVTAPDEGDAVQELGRAGAVAALLGALSTSCRALPAAWVHCCTALAALLEALPEQAGGAVGHLPMLVSALRDPQAPAESKAATASVLCAACSASQACRDAAQRCDAVPVLALLLREPGLASSAAAALSACMTEHYDNASAVVRDRGALATLVKLLDVTANDEAPFYAAAACRTLCAAGLPAAWAMHSVGAQSRLAQVAGDAAAHLLVRLECVRALAENVECFYQGGEPHQAALAAALRPETLATLLSAPAAHQFWREAVVAASTLLAYAQPEDWAGAAETPICVAALAQLLASALDGAASETADVDVDFANAALGALASPAALVHDAVTATELDAVPGVMDAALTLMQLPPPSPAPAAACRLLAARYTHGTPPSADVVAASAPLLAAALKHEGSELAVCAARATAALACNSDNSAALRRAGCVAKLVALCGAGPLTASAEGAAAALRQLVTNGGGGCRRAVCAAAGVSALIALCSEAPSALSSHEAACALATLAVDEEGLDALEAAGAVSALRGVAASAHPHSDAHAAATACLAALGRAVSAASSSSPGEWAQPAAPGGGLHTLKSKTARQSTGGVRTAQQATQDAAQVQSQSSLSSMALAARIEAMQLGAPLNAALPQEVADAVQSEAQAVVAADVQARQRQAEAALLALCEAEEVHAQASDLWQRLRQQAQAAYTAATVAADIESRSWLAVADAESALSAAVAAHGNSGPPKAVAQARLAAANAKAQAAQAASQSAAQRAAAARHVASRAHASVTQAAEAVGSLALAVPRARQGTQERVYHRHVPGRAGSEYQRTAGLT
jgi:hypothetical protein